MLVKKELMTVPVLPVSVEADGKADYLIAVELVELPRSGWVLAADLTETKSGALACRFFSDGTNFYTVVGWPDGDWEKSNPAINYYSTVKSRSRGIDVKLAEQFLGKTERQSWRADGVLGVIDAFISEWKNEKKIRADDRREQLMQKHFAMFPQLPDDLKEYCDDHVFENGYIFFEKLTKDHRRFGQCGSCGKRFEISEAVRQNGETVCPECGKRSVYKAVWRTEVIEERARICITAKVQEQLLIRWVDVTRCTGRTGKSYTFADYAYNLYLDDGRKRKIVCYEQRKMMYGYGNYWKRMRNGDQTYSRAYLYTNNLREVFGQRYYNVDLQAGLEGKRIQLCFSSLLNNLKNRPEAEYLFKLGMPLLAAEAHRIGTKPSGKTGFQAVLGISRQYLPMYQDMDISWWEHSIIRNYGAWVSREDMEAFRRLKLGSNMEFGLVETTLKCMSFGKMTRYFGKQMQETKRSAEHLMRLYRDYISMAQEMKIDLTRKDLRYPKNVQQAHDTILNQLNKIKWEAEDAAFAKAVNVLYEKIPIREYEDEEYCIIFPKLRTEMMAEGNSLGHCVGSKSYSDRHMQGEHMVFFVRKKICREKSFFTMEADMVNYKIIQLHGKGNCNAPKDVWEFASGFVRALKQAEQKNKRSKTA